MQQTSFKWQASVCQMKDPEWFMPVCFTTICLTVLDMAYESRLELAH